MPGLAVSPPTRAQAVLLSGEHPTLPLAELLALLDVHDPQASVRADGLVAVVQPGNLAGTRRALARMALAHEWGDLWAQEPETSAGLDTVVGLVPKLANWTGSAAVVAERRGTGKHLDRTTVERAVGAALKQAGHRIDLKAPTHVAFAWLTDGRIVLGERGGLNDRSSHEARISDERAHFSPVSLHPRRAASLLHLARVAPGGRVLDPFCGTGAFVLEAALEGYDAWGSDIDSFMVQGTLQTLADHGDAALDGTVIEADIGAVSELVAGVQGIVTDFPYGRASSSHDEGLAQLYARAFAAFHDILPRGGHAVVGHAQPELLPDLAKQGFAEIERHTERVHKSLTRHYLVAKRL